MNMKFAALAVLGTFSAVALAPHADAADNGFYLGAGVTRTDFKLSVDGIDGDETLDDSSFKVIAGFRPLDWLAVEANYLDLGKAEFEDGTGVSIDSKALSASALFIAEFGIVDLFGKVGVVKWDSDYRQTDVGTVSDDGVEPMFGAGLGLHFGSIGARLEYELFKTEALDNEVNNDIKTLSLSVTYTFL
ncbi:MAG: porin family protein [Pseudomonadota bacterium]